MTQSEFNFIREALAGKCDNLLKDIVEADTALKKQRDAEKVAEAEQTENNETETKGE